MRGIIASPALSHAYFSHTVTTHAWAQGESEEALD
jgi:hypothetical protein